jgi:hypothetical protein
MMLLKQQHQSSLAHFPQGQGVNDGRMKRFCANCGVNRAVCIIAMSKIGLPLLLRQSSPTGAPQ